MTRFQVKLTTYDGTKAVDYARDNWSKVCSDGRIMTSNGVAPGCSREGYPKGTELLHEAGWSQTYGGFSASDFLVIPAEGSPWRQTTESFPVPTNPSKYHKLSDKGPARLLVVTFRESLVKSIDKAELDQNSEIHPLYMMRLPLPDRDSKDWQTIGHYVRIESTDDSPGSRSSGLIFIAKIESDNKFVTLEDEPIELQPNTKLNVTYTYCKNGQRLSWGPIDDCAHFLSCCLQAGGLNVWPNEDPRGVGGRKRPCAYGQHNVKGLYNMFKWLAEEKHGRQVEFIADKIRWKEAEQTDEAAESYWKGFFEGDMKPGDVILYGWEKNQYAHSALYVGTMKTGLDPEEYPRIACHTYSRFPSDECYWDYARWNIGRQTPGRIYTLIHITSNTAT